jgi:hypothetical protein
MMSLLPPVRRDWASARLSQEGIGEVRASEMQVRASDVMEGIGGPLPRSPCLLRSPGMHLGHELLLALTIALALFATLLLNATH